MMILRFIVLAGVLVTIGFYAPTRATAADSAPALSAFDSKLVEQKKDDEVPRPRPTPGPKDISPAVSVFDFNEQKKTETPPRPRPKPGPKDGGEDE